MKYINTINVFWESYASQLKSSAIAVYFALLDSARKQCWPKQIAIPTTTLKDKAGITSNNTFYRSLASLTDLGLIGCTLGAGSRPPTFSICRICGGKAGNRRDSSGNPAGLGRESSGNPMGIGRESDGNPAGIQRDSDGTPMGLRRDSENENPADGTPMGIRNAANLTAAPVSENQNSGQNSNAAEKERKKQREKDSLSLDNNNIYNNIYNNTDIERGREKEKERDRGCGGKGEKEKEMAAEKQTRHRYGQYQNVMLTDDQLATLQTEFPDDWSDRLERVSEYCAATGQSYKNYLAVVRSWARRDKERGTNGQNGQAATSQRRGAGSCRPLTPDEEALVRELEG